uniref:Bacteriophage T4 Gp32 single-stranded DNA-binding domain-containing protein n=2 Tax=viral metagenome TaxID=1070528 RepID=A0A6M3K1K7_9ZZZZ
MSKDKEKKQRYYTADSEKIQKKLAEIGQGDFFKPKEGPNKIRILPPWSKSGLWFKEATLHYGLNDDSGRERGYPCLKQFDKDCPICAKIEELKEGGTEDKEMAKRIGPRTKFYANVLDRKTGGVLIWGFSRKTLGVLLGYDSDKEDYGDITNPESGFDVVVERTGTTKNDTRYQIRCKPKPSEVDMDTVDLHDLDKEVIDDLDEEALEEIVEANFGMGKKKKKKHADEDEEEEDEEEESPKKKKSKSEDDEDEDEEDEEEEEEKPKKKKHKKDEDDEEDEEDEDDDK